jgi:hypothetical protein
MVVGMNKKLIGIILVCLVAGLGIGYLIGNITYPVPVVDLRQQWATLSIYANGGNYTARYGAGSYNETVIYSTTVNGPSETKLNITRPKSAPLGGLLGGWTIDVVATAMPYNGITPAPPYNIVSITIRWAGPQAIQGGSQAYADAAYPDEAHITIDLS